LFEIARCWKGDHGAHDSIRGFERSQRRDVASGSLLAHLAYLGLDDYPRAVPVDFLWDDKQFVICTAVKAPKVQALMQNPKVALSVAVEALLHAQSPADIQRVDPTNSRIDARGNSK
jgi:nitroimidazol reductase NimA-like FMN-containing flavoprotein (pyridoxamine 5'-phosphate oxidase superfamily)